MSDTKTITNPVEALIGAEKMNTELLNEVKVIYAELDRYREALTKISDEPGRAGQIARTALQGG